MFLVTVNGGILYLGDSQKDAIAIKQVNENSHLYSVNGYDEVEAMLQKNTSEVDPAISDVFSDTFNELVDQLDKVGINQDLSNRIVSKGQQLVGDARSLGIQGMKVVGDGFVALGDLLRGKPEVKDKTE